MARGRLIKKIPALEVALEGHVTEHHRFLLAMLLEQLERLEEMIGRLDDRIAEVLESDALNAGCDEEAAEAPLPFSVAVELLTTVPGFDRRTAEYVLAETGTDMSRFPTAGHLASWAGGSVRAITIARASARAGGRPKATAGRGAR